MTTTKPTYQILKQELSNKGIPYIECKNIELGGEKTFALHIPCSSIFYIEEINKLKFMLLEFKDDLLISKINNHDYIVIKIKNDGR